MTRQLFSRHHKDGGTTTGISRATRVGLLVGGAVVIASSAISASAATAGTPKPTASGPPTAVHTKAAKPVKKVAPAKRPVARPAIRASVAIASASVADSCGSTDAASNAVRTCELWATTGSVSVANGTATPLSVSIWGFSLSSTPGTGTLPGPTLVAREDDTSLQVTLHNALPAAAGNLALEIPASSNTPDLSGIANGGTNTYTFTGLKPGTYVYEAGANGNGQRQIAMGLTGLLIVRPSTWVTTADPATTCHSAYDPAAPATCDLASSFTAESPVQLNELSTTFNADPVNGDLHNYKPDVFLVNGRSFDSSHPMDGSIPVAKTDQKLLLRYANLGLRERSISIGSGVTNPLYTPAITGGQRELASDSNLLKIQPDLSALYLNPVQTADTMTAVDPSLVTDTLIPVYDQGQHLVHWVGATPTEGAGIGGMIGMLHVVDGGPGTVSGPKTMVNVADASKSLDGNTDLDASGPITSAAGISSAEWFLDSPGAAGTGKSSNDPASGLTVSGTTFTLHVAAADLVNLISNDSTRDGQHEVWVRAADGSATPVWGIASGDTFSYNVSGPLMTGVTVHSTPTNRNRANDIDGTTSLDVLGTAAASLPNWVVQQVEYCLDSPCAAGGSGTALPLVTSALPLTSTDVSSTYTSTTAADSSLTGPTAMTTNGYAGDTISATWTVGATTLTSTGTIAGNTGNTVTLSAAGWSNTTPPDGTAWTISGTSGTAGQDASFVAFAGGIDLTSIATGSHTIYIHGCEASSLTAPSCRWGVSGNDATTAQAAFVIDTTPPATSIDKLSPEPNNGFLSGSGNVADLNQERVDATFNDTATGGSPIAMAEVFITQPNVLPQCYTGPTTAPLSGSACTSLDPASIYGKGAEMVPTGGAWNKGVTQGASAFIPLTDVRSMPEGQVWFWVHSQDRAGNWTPFTLADTTGYKAMTLDKTMPVIDSGSTTSTGATFSISGTAHDPISGGVRSAIARAEYFVITCTSAARTTCSTDPGPGNGTAMTVSPNDGTTATISASGVPNIPLHSAGFVRVMDLAGNWTLVDLTAKNLAESNEPDLAVCPTLASTNCELTEEYGPVRFTS